MQKTSDHSNNGKNRSYKRAQSIVFLKTKEAFGGLSNMAAGYPLEINGVCIRTSEALYQACRFPHLPQIQQLIIDQKSPMTAKMKGKPHRSNSRPDWERVQIKVMRWCLRVKLVKNWKEFSTLLLNTDDLPIVEESRRDQFWGAKPSDDETLVGMNVLGRLLMELRDEIKTSDGTALLTVEPLAISNFELLGKPIEPAIAATTSAQLHPDMQNTEQAQTQESAQGSLFDMLPPKKSS